ncbi:MAG: HlyD family secretion protein [Flavisolibacter sp.]
MKTKYTVTDRIITRITGWMAGLALIALSAWGIQTLWDLHLFEQTNDAQVQEYVNPVISRAGGFIVSVHFEENQYVKKGDTLLLIDPRESEIQQEQTEASIKKTEAQLEVLRSNIKTLQETAQAAKAQIATTVAKVWKQKLEYDRYNKLYQVESATRQKLEDIKATLDVYASEQQSAQDNYEADLSKIRDKEAEIGVEKAELARLNALLDRHKLDVSYTVITAPYNGRIGKRTIEVGQMINVGEVLAFIVDDETDKWVVANFKETQVANIHIGDSAQFTADAFPDKVFKGTVISFSPATGSSFSLLPPDNSTGNYVKIVQRVPVRIRVAGKRPEIEALKVGMNVNVSIAKKQHHG